MSHARGTRSGPHRTKPQIFAAATRRSSIGGARPQVILAQLRLCCHLLHIIECCLHDCGALARSVGSITYGAQQATLPFTGCVVPIPAPFALGLSSPHSCKVGVLVEGLPCHRVMPCTVPPDVLRQRPTLRTRHATILLKAVIAAMSQITRVHVCIL